MGKFGADMRRAYWLSRVLDSMPSNPPRDKKFSECSPEEQASRYLHRAYEIMTGETFDRQVFNDMMNPYKGKK